MKSILPAIGIGILLLGSQASAADLAVKAPPMPPTASITWTGWYVGLNAGGHWSLDDLSTVTTTGFFPAGGPAAIDSTSPTALKARGFAGGLQAGYNWQFGQYVAGVEGDFNWLAGTATRAFTGFPVINPTDSMTNSDRPSYLATIRPRLGTTMFNPRALVYVTGGAAFGGIETTDIFRAANGRNTTSVSASKALPGWTVGIGAEYSITNNWSVKGEFLYVDLRSFSSTAPPFAASSASITYKHTDYDEFVGRLGLNYKFGY